jgi:TPR repeat protein
MLFWRAFVGAGVLVVSTWADAASNCHSVPALIRWADAAPGDGYVLGLETILEKCAVGSGPESVLAQSKLGRMYTFGIGVKIDYEAALLWTTKAADSGDADAQFLLGQLHSLGLGTPRNEKTGFVWFSRAGEQGHPLAWLKLGLIYDEGKVVQKDLSKAVTFFRKAAETGNSDAQFFLGIAHKDGKGVVQDYVIAHMWLNVAAGLGSTSARDIRDLVLSKRMTLEQVAEAQSLARRCAESQYRDCGRR